MAATGAGECAPADVSASSLSSVQRRVEGDHSPDDPHRKDNPPNAAFGLVVPSRTSLTKRLGHSIADVRLRLLGERPGNPVSGFEVELHQVAGRGVRDHARTLPVERPSMRPAAQPSGRAGHAASIARQ